VKRFAVVKAVALAAAGLPALAWASETPLYQPAPAWVSAPPAIPATPVDDLPPLVLLDFQKRIEGDRLTSYVHQRTRIASAELLSQAATLTLPWAPDKGDLIIHGLTILRGDQRIDLLAKGQKFTVLRREQSLEQRELTGILTATLAVEGLEVGDQLDLRFSVTGRDPALGGRVQDVVPLPALPLRIGAGRVRYLWSSDSAPKYKILADGVTATPVRKGDLTELTLAMPSPKPKDMPEDAPARYRRPPLIEVASFADWADVSRTFVPLYKTDGLIAPGSPLANEVAAIQKADATPIGRAQRALELVQDKIRYLAVGMDGGNYVPQAPAKTLEVRYGDCKAKTLMLLAMLHGMGIEAEPVVANIGLGDAVPERLPSAAAFNHVFVRATIEGQVLWLDGTGSNARLPDIRDTPGVGYVLPIRAAGATPILIETHPNARPIASVTIVADESGALDLPSPIEVTMVMHGPMAAQLRAAKSLIGPNEQRDLISTILQQAVGEGQFADGTIAPDAASGDVVVRAKGVVTTNWSIEDRRRKRSLGGQLADMNFAPDRSRPDRNAIPVAGSPPIGLERHVRVKLPDGGRGFTLEGTADADQRLAGFVVKRMTRLTGGTIAMDERFDATGAEVPATRIAAERDAVATAKANVPRVVAPVDTPRRWTLDSTTLAKSSQVQAIRAIFGKAIAADPEEMSGYQSRAAFESGIGNHRAALADLDKVIAKEPTVELYLARSGVQSNLGDLSKALADAERARALDPAAEGAIEAVAETRAEMGDLKSAIVLLDERIAAGGESRASLREKKAELLGEFGDPKEGIALYDTLIAAKPGTPTLLNGRCWAKGTRNVMLDTALKDCTKAIELSDDTLQALDSRALVWYRMGRYPEALADLDTVLAADPDMANSLYLRAAVYKATQRDAEAAADLVLARRIDSTVDRQYARYGFKI
jgi:tetratricopeptide (TPR) repeat protein/transglutaminase-like putative cysteine protease